MSIVKNEEKLQTTENVEKLTLTRHYHKTKRKLYILRVEEKEINSNLIFLISLCARFFYIARLHNIRNARQYLRNGWL